MFFLLIFKTLTTILNNMKKCEHNLKTRIRFVSYFLSSSVSSVPKNCIQIDFNNHMQIMQYHFKIQFNRYTISASHNHNNFKMGKYDIF
jgi:hypothetical protein